MNKGLLFILAFILHISVICRAQSIYGISGLIKTPNAFIVDTGKCVMGIASFKDYYNDTENFYSQWTVNFNVGFHSRFELGVRLAGYPGSAGGDAVIYNVGFDRILNGKILLIKEKKAIPQISIGAQDIVGTRYHNSTYIAVSKNIQAGKSFSVLLNSGYGSKINDKIFGDSHEHSFIGFFGGTEIGYKEIIYLISEYDAKDFNAGARLAALEWLNINVLLINLKYPSCGISLKFAI